jgi:hypothetical protein
MRPLVGRVTEQETGGWKAFEMNPYDGHRLYRIQRTKTRAEILADDARRGRRAASVSGGSRALAGEARTAGIMALNAIRAMAAQVRAYAYDGDRTGSPASRRLT